MAAVSHPAEFFARPVEAAVLDAANPQIVAKHLICAAAEEPLAMDDEFFPPVRSSRGPAPGHARTASFCWTPRAPATSPHASGPSVWWTCAGAGESLAIVDQKGRVVGSFDGVRVYKEGYPGAMYLHRGRTYQVKELDLEHRKVRVAPLRADYYTHARSEKETEILEETGRRPVANFLVRQGRLKVTETVTGYERRRLSGGDLMGVYPLDLPPLTFETHGLWMDIEDMHRQALERAGPALHGLHPRPGARGHRHVPLVRPVRPATTSEASPFPCTPRPARPGCSSTTGCPAGWAWPSGASGIIEELAGAGGGAPGLLRLRGGLPGLRVLAQVRLGQQAPGQTGGSAAHPPAFGQEARGGRGRDLRRPAAPR